MYFFPPPRKTPCGAVPRRHGNKLSPPLLAQYYDTESRFVLSCGWCTGAVAHKRAGSLSQQPPAWSTAFSIVFKVLNPPVQSRTHLGSKTACWLFVDSCCLRRRHAQSRSTSFYPLFPFYISCGTLVPLTSSSVGCSVRYLCTCSTSTPRDPRGVLARLCHGARQAQSE